MPMFARRRLQAMLDEVAAGLTDKKVNDLLGRLGKKTDARNVNRGVAHGSPGTTFSNILDRGYYDPSKHAVI